MQTLKIGIPQIESQICFVTGNRYERATAGLMPRIDYPSYEDNILIALKAQKRDILENIAGAIADGQRVAIFNFNPIVTDFCFIRKHLERALTQLKQPKKQGLLIGGRLNSSTGLSLFNNLQGFMTSHNIPCSLFKEHRQNLGASSIACFNKGNNKVTWLVTNPNIPDSVIGEGKPVEEFLPKVFRSFSAGSSHLRTNDI